MQQIAAGEPGEEEEPKGHLAGQDQGIEHVEKTWGEAREFEIRIEIETVGDESSLFL
jgi:hypothetical protein